MRTVIVDQHSPEIEEILASRRAIGADTHDEVWEGAYHMSPAPTGQHAWLTFEIGSTLRPLAKRAGLIGTTEFNVGTGAEDYRVPDFGLHRALPLGAWIETAALVVEVVSPGDESWLKFDFYAAHRVDEIVIADPAEGRLWWFRLVDEAYVEVQRSDLLGADVATIAAGIEWPPAG